MVNQGLTAQYHVVKRGAGSCYWPAPKKNKKGDFGNGKF